MQKLRLFLHWVLKIPMTPVMAVILGLAWLTNPDFGWKRNWKSFWDV